MIELLILESKLEVHVEPADSLSLGSYHSQLFLQVPIQTLRIGAGMVSVLLKIIGLNALPIPSFTTLTGGIAFGERIFGLISEHHMHVIRGLYSLCSVSSVKGWSARVCLSRSPGHGLQWTQGYVYLCSFLILCEPNMNKF